MHAAAALVYVGILVDNGVDKGLASTFGSGSNGSFTSQRGAEGGFTHTFAQHSEEDARGV